MAVLADEHLIALSTPSVRAWVRIIVCMVKADINTMN